jgi:hypothetical protein
MPKSKRETVYELARPSRCHNCDTKLEVGQIVRLQNKEDDREALCRNCAGLGDMEVVRTGNAQLTRLASKYSGESYVIMRWSELWKCYERQGILVTKDALQKAQSEL